MSEDRAAAAAIAAGLRYLSSVQAESGELPVFSAYSLDMTDRRHLDPCFFGTALVAAALGDCPEASRICARACAFIEAQRRPGDLWTYYKKGHRHVYPPRDMDDTAMGTAALIACGRRQPGNRTILLGNRDRSGMFLTWFLPWRDGPNLRLLGRDWRQLLWLRRYRTFFANSLCEPNDVDAVVNANAAAALGAFPGEERVVEQLLSILREGREDCCDKYYDDPVDIRYLFARALAGRCPEAGELIVQRAEAGPNATALQIALTMLTRATWDAPPQPSLRQRLMAAQLESGEWPIAPFYSAGRKRIGYMHFPPNAPNVFRSGSEAITTAFCIAALHSARSTEG